NFTTEDGLTDNEVLFIRSDSKGRVWIMPFNKTICYYYNGRIHNPDNDSMIGKISFNSTVVMAGESRNGEIYFLTSDAVYSFRDGAPIKKIADFTRLAEKHGLRAIDFIPACLTDQFPYTMVLYNHHEVFINQN